MPAPSMPATARLPASLPVPCPLPAMPSSLPAAWRLFPELPQTMLLVEDSRIAAEAVRLICRRLGIRLRRADCLEMAQAHLRVYRPDVVLVDPGLPDGSGLSLIAAMQGARWRPARIVGFSGDPMMEAPCRRAGADAFIAKPLQPAQHLRSLLGAQAPAESADPAGTGAPRRAGQRSADSRKVPSADTPGSDREVPAGDGSADQGMKAGSGGDGNLWRNHGTDPLALRDDLRHARALLSGARAEEHIGYAARFLGGIARCAGDAGLMRAAERALASRNPAPLRATLDQRMSRDLDCI